MTFTRATLLALAAFLAVPAFAAGQAFPAKEDLSHWRSAGAILMDANALARGQLVEFELTPEVFSQGRRGLGDLRITNGAGRIVPHVVRSGKVVHEAAAPAAPADPVRMFDPVRKAGKSSSVKVEFAQSQPRNRIEIITAGSDFLRRIAVEGSPDGSSWRMLRESDWLFSVSHENGAYVKDAADLPENDCRFFRATVFNQAGDANDVQIKAVRASRIAPTSPPPPEQADAPVPARAFSTYGRQHVTCVELDLNFEKLPLSRIVFPDSNQHFFRSVEVLGRDRRTISDRVEEPWRSLGGGVIYHLEGGPGLPPSTRLNVDLADGCRFLKIVIGPLPQAPEGDLLTLLPKVYRTRHIAAFRADGPGPYKLYAGNAQAAATQPPAGLAEGSPTGPATAARLETLSPNPLFAEALPKPLALSQKYKGVIWPIMFMLALLAIMMIRRQMRRAKPRVTSDEDIMNL